MTFGVVPNQFAPPDIMGAEHIIDRGAHAGVVTVGILSLAGVGVGGAEEGGDDRQDAGRVHAEVVLGAEVEVQCVVDGSLLQVGQEHRLGAHVGLPRRVQAGHGRHAAKCGAGREAARGGVVVVQAPGRSA